MFEGIDKVVIVYKEHYLNREQRLALIDRIEKDRIKLEQQVAQQDKVLKKVPKIKTLTMNEYVAQSRNEIAEEES